jgi:DDE superfamily endonuclease
LNKQWCIPPEANAEFVCAMEDILDVYHRPDTSENPLVCMDESSKQQVIETRQPIEAESGQVERYDDEYERNGVSNLFMLFAPFEDWRHVKVTDRRTKVDFAHCIKDVLTLYYPNADTVMIVMDNLNTHHPSSLYEAFEPAEARSLLERCAFHYTPKHGSWLNMAEIEFSALQRQCLDRRIPDQETLRDEIVAWEERRNAQAVSVNWRFTTADARIRLKRLYPSIKT